ncbi:MAG: cyclase family protein [Acidobacteriia bacterium]|nr:cyclase family protein [Terriglobia bacterium]
MRFGSFIIACALGLALLLFADGRPVARPQERYSQVVDLTRTAQVKANSERSSGTRIISPAAMIPGTWGAAQIPAERLIAPLVVMDLNAPSAQISVDDVATWEAQHGNVPQGAVVAVRRAGSPNSSSSSQFPVSADAAQFLMDARYTRGFIVETPASLGSDRTLSRQIALHGNYVVEESTPLAALPETGSLIIVAPAKNGDAAESPVRVLAMVPATVHGA